MALTRKMLKAMGIEEEKIEQIIDEHVAVKSGLQTQIEELREKAEKAESLQRQLDEAGEDGARYEKLSAEFDAYKAKVESENATREKAELYKSLLVEAGVDAKRIDTVMRVADLSGIEVKDGAIADSESVVNGIKSEWADFIPKGSTEGANVPNPPHQTGGSTAPQTLKEALYERYNR